MSNTAAIASVTAALTNMIQTAVSADDVVSSGTVTARPPDRARQGHPVNQINLFLYRTTIDAAWRNQDPPSIRPGESGQPPLPLVLSYLVTAYGEDDNEILAHRLLGIAMGVLNDRPVLSRDALGRALDPAPGSAVEAQVERIRITPDPRPQDEISRMWATFATGYRLSVSYDAAVVLIDSSRPVAAPMPVLMRGPADTGPAVALSPFAQLTGVTPPNRQPSARAGDALTVTGHRLDAVTAITVSHPLAAEPLTLAPQRATPGRLEVTLPTPATLPAGVATVRAVFALGPGDPIVSNAVPLALAPGLTSPAALTVTLAASGATTITVGCAPEVQPSQTTALIVGDQIIPGAVITAATSTVSFRSAQLVAGTFPLRLRVDAVDSIPVRAIAAPSGTDQPAPMQLDPNQQVVIS